MRIHKGAKKGASADGHHAIRVKSDTAAAKGLNTSTRTDSPPLLYRRKRADPDCLRSGGPSACSLRRSLIRSAEPTSTAVAAPLPMPPRRRTARRSRAASSTPASDGRFHSLGTRARVRRIQRRGQPQLFVHWAASLPRRVLQQRSSSPILSRRSWSCLRCAATSAGPTIE